MSSSSRIRIVLVLLALSASPALAQQWTGGYISAHIGFSKIPEGSDNTVVFDRDLNGEFDDTIVTAAGANAFSPGFCVGAASSAVPSGGCTQDDSGMDFGGRAGYDWQMGSLAFGLLADVAAVDHTDSLTAFSTTPAFYTFTREINWVGALRARAGFGGERFLVYGTGGPAWADLDRSFASSNTVNTFVESDEGMSWGYQLGGGVDFKFNGRWTATGEYLWTNIMDEDRYTVRAQGPAPATNPFILGNANGADLRREDALKFGAFRFSLGYRF